MPPPSTTNPSKKKVQHKPAVTPLQTFTTPENPYLNLKKRSNAQPYVSIENTQKWGINPKMNKDDPAWEPSNTTTSATHWGTTSNTGWGHSESTTDLTQSGWGQPTTTTETASNWGENTNNPTQSKGWGNAHPTATTDHLPQPKMNQAPEARTPPKEENPTKLDNEDTRLIYLDVDVHHKESDQRMPVTPLTPIDVEDMVSDVLQHLEHQHDQLYAFVHNCTLIHSKPRKGNKSNEIYSTYQVRLQPKINTVKNADVNDLIEILDTYFSGLLNYTLHIQDNKNKPYSGHKWARFTNMKLSTVNNSSHTSFGLLMGLAPLIHGKHHKTTNWILAELFHRLKSYFPDEMECHDILIFRSMFGIRHGRFGDYTRRAYHVHSTTLQNIDSLINAIHNYQEKNKSLPRIFNMKIMIDLFPTAPDRKEKTETISQRLKTTNTSLSQLKKVTLEDTIDYGLSFQTVHELYKLKYLVTFSLTLIEKSFYITLHFTNNHTTAHYQPQTFSNTFQPKHEKPKHEKTKKISPIQKALVLPTREDKQTIKRNKLLDIFDKEDTKANDNFADFNLEEDDSIKKYYAVAVGRETGVFKDWNICQSHTHGYSGACFRSFTSLEKANQFLVMKTTNSTNECIDDDNDLKAHQRHKPLFSNVAQITMNSPAASANSNRSRKISTPLKKLAFFGELSESQQDPPPPSQEYSNHDSSGTSSGTNGGETDHLMSSSETSTPGTQRDYYARCPTVHHTALQALLDSGVPKEIIEQAIDGFLKSVDTANKTTNVRR